MITLKYVVLDFVESLCMCNMVCVCVASFLPTEIAYVHKFVALKRNQHVFKNVFDSDAIENGHIQF